jgi:hypothetical protein
MYSFVQAGKQLTTNIGFENPLLTYKTIFRNGSNLDIKNLLVFLNKAATNVTFKIGTDLNKKVIVDPLIT